MLEADADECPHEHLRCGGVLLGVVELMRARGLLGDWAAAAVPGAGSPARGPGGTAAGGCPVAAGRPAGRA